MNHLAPSEFNEEFKEVYEKTQKLICEKFQIGLMSDPDQGVAYGYVQGEKFEAILYVVAALTASFLGPAIAQRQLTPAEAIDGFGAILTPQIVQHTSHCANVLNIPIEEILNFERDEDDEEWEDEEF